MDTSILFFNGTGSSTSILFDIDQVVLFSSYFALSFLYFLAGIFVVGAFIRLTVFVEGSKVMLPRLALGLLSIVSLLRVFFFIFFPFVVTFLPDESSMDRWSIEAFIDKTFMLADTLPGVFLWMAYFIIILFWVSMVVIWNEGHRFIELQLNQVPYKEAIEKLRDIKKTSPYRVVLLICANSRVLFFSTTLIVVLMQISLYILIYIVPLSKLTEIALLSHILFVFMFFLVVSIQIIVGVLFIHFILKNKDFPYVNSPTVTSSFEIAITLFGCSICCCFRILVLILMIMNDASWIHLTFGPLFFVPLYFFAEVLPTSLLAAVFYRKPKFNVQSVWTKVNPTEEEIEEEESHTVN